MGVRDVAFTLMALGHVAGCRGKQYDATGIMAEAVCEIGRLTAEVERLTAVHALACQSLDNAGEEIVRLTAENAALRGTRITSQQIADWAGRHNIQGSLGALRCAVDDAASLHLAEAVRP